MLPSSTISYKDGALLPTTPARATFSISSIPASLVVHQFNSLPIADCRLLAMKLIVYHRLIRWYIKSSMNSFRFYCSRAKKLYIAQYSIVFDISGKSESTNLQRFHIRKKHVVKMSLLFICPLLTAVRLVQRTLFKRRVVIIELEISI